MANHAHIFLAHSRAYRAGKQINEFHPSIFLSDRIAAKLESILTSLGFGEELIVVLRMMEC